MTAPMTANTTQTAVPLFVPAELAFNLPQGDQRAKILVSSVFTQNAFSLILIDADPQAGVPPHIHLHEDETFYVLEGRFAGEVGGKSWEAGPGDTLYAPRQIVHSWKCISETPGRLFLLVTPGQNFETFFQEMTGVFAAVQGGSVADLGPRLGALAQQHGITMLPQDLTGYAPTRFPLYVPAGEGLSSGLGDHGGRIKVGSQHTENDFLLGEGYVNKDGGVPPHIHHREDETFYILDGKIEFQIGEQIIEAGPGDTVVAPRDIPHAFRCTSEGGARLLGLLTPGNNFQAFSAAMVDLQMVASRDMANPAVMHQFVALAAQYGIDMLPPIK